MVFLQGIGGDADLNADGYVTGSELGMHLQEKVVNYTRGGQHPQYGKINNPKLDRGDFIFVSPQAPEKKMAARTTSEAAVPQTSTRAEKSPAVGIQSDRLTSIPEAARATRDVLKRGQGNFVLDDFEDRDLWSQNFYDKWSQHKKGRGRISISTDTAEAANGTACSMKIDYKVKAKSALTVRIGMKTPHWKESHAKMAYDLSRFNGISFYLKGKKEATLLSKPNKIFTAIICYSERSKSKHGSIASYYNRSEIIPQKKWRKIEIPFDDFVPSNWTKKNVSQYPLKPDLAKVLQIFFLISSFKGEDGAPHSNIIWIDEIELQ